MRCQSGFVMADAMIALTLVSVLFAALLGINQNSLNAVENSNKRLTAFLLAQSIIERTSFETRTGTTKLDGITYDWAISVRDITSASRPRARLNEIIVRVEWRGRQAPQSLEITTARLGGVS